MVNLQHAGGATRFLDVTWDSFVALWFATHGQNQSDDGVVYCYVVDSRYCPFPEQVETWDSITSFPPGKPVLYTPPRANERVKAQSAAFLTCVLNGPLSGPSVFTDPTEYSDIRRIRIRSSLKKVINEWFTTNRKMREFDLFPDFAGYAHTNSQGSPFIRDIDELYDGSNGVFPNRWSPESA